MLLTAVARMSGFALGAVLYAFLLLLLIRKRPRLTLDWALLGAVGVAWLWYAAGAVASFYQAGVGEQPSGHLAGLLQSISRIGLALIPAALLHVALALRPRRSAALAYLLAPLAWWTLAAGLQRTFVVLFAASLASSIVELLSRARATTGEATERRFRTAMAVALGVTVAGAAGGPESAWIVLGGLAPAFCLLYFISRFNVLGLVISRRIFFAWLLGGLSAIYLLVVRRASDWAQQKFEVFGPAIEVMLILAAVGVWVPLYAWMNRVLAKRTQVYADFGKHLIQEVAAIFDFEERLEYIPRQLGRTFKLRRVLLATTEDPEPRIAMFRSAGSSPPVGAVPFAAIADAVRKRRIAAVAGPRSEPDLLSGTGFNYLFPLWYEDRLVGLLLVDTSPRLYLDDDEAILWGLSRQISHAIESCRLIERKISLETALARSEHLASLGQMAAMIAHEVKNPLSSIKTLAQLMQEDAALSDAYRRDLSYIVGEINRLNSCVDQLLTFARPIPEGASEIALPELLEDISRVLSREYADRHIRIEHRAPRDLTLKNVDPQSLHQIVLNLALNAAQASYPEGVVEMRAERGAGGKVTITVADHGSGIPREMRAKVFEPFFTTKQKGSGLGLAIVARNVRHLGGDVRLESPVNGEPGTAITVTLPAEVA
jgi:signal transduction histidine kinase